MKILRKFLSRTQRAAADARDGEYGRSGWLADDQDQSFIRETRPYVVAMREVAADMFRTC